MGQAVLQSRVGTTKWDKVGQELSSSALQKSNKRNRKIRFWQPTSSFTPNFPGNKFSLNYVIIKKEKKEKPRPTTDVSA